MHGQTNERKLRTDIWPTSFSHVRAFLHYLGCIAWNCTDPVLCSIYFSILNVHPFLMSKSIFIVLIVIECDWHVHICGCGPVVPSSAYHCPLQKDWTDCIIETYETYHVYMKWVVLSVYYSDWFLGLCVYAICPNLRQHMFFPPPCMRLQLINDALLCIEWLSL